MPAERLRGGPTTTDATPNGEASHTNGHAPTNERRVVNPMAVAMDVWRDGTDQMATGMERAAHGYFAAATAGNRLMQRTLEAWWNPASVLFKAGGDVAQFWEAETAYPEIEKTPKEIVWQPEDGYPFKMYYYETPADLKDVEKNGDALVIQYAAMSDESIVEEGFVRAAQEQGFEVFLSSAGNPGSRHEDVGLDDIALRYLDAAVDKIDKFCEERNIGLKRKVLYGICQGGYIAAGYNALRPGVFDAQVLVVPYLTNQGGGEMVRMIQDDSFESSRASSVAANVDLVSGSFLVDGAASRDSEKYIYGPHKRLMQDVREGNENGIEKFRRTNAWTKESRRRGMKPRAHGQIIDVARDDKLVKGETIWRDGEEEVVVDLGKTITPTLLVAALRDDLVPSIGLEAVFPLFGDGTLDSEYFPIDATHFEGVLKGYKAQAITWPKMWSWLKGQRDKSTTRPLAPAA